MTDNNLALTALEVTLTVLAGAPRLALLGPRRRRAPAAARARPAPHSPAPNSMGRKSQHSEGSDRRAAARGEA